MNCDSILMIFGDTFTVFFTIFEIFGVIEKYEIQNCKLVDV